MTGSVHLQRSTGSRDVLQTGIDRAFASKGQTDPASDVDSDSKSDFRAVMSQYQPDDAGSNSQAPTNSSQIDDTKLDLHAVLNQSPRDYSISDFQSLIDPATTDDSQSSSQPAAVSSTTDDSKSSSGPVTVPSTTDDSKSSSQPVTVPSDTDDSKSTSQPVLVPSTSDDAKSNQAAEPSTADDQKSGSHSVANPGRSGVPKSRHQPVASNPVAPKSRFQPVTDSSATGASKSLFQPVKDSSVPVRSKSDWQPVMTESNPCDAKSDSQPATASWAFSNTSAGSQPAADSSTLSGTTSDPRSVTDSNPSTSSADDSASPEPKKQDPARTLALPIQVIEPLREVLPLLAQNPFAKPAPPQTSTYTADVPVGTETQASTAQTNGAPPDSLRQAPAAPPSIDANDAPPAPSTAPVAFAAKLTPDDTATSTHAQQPAPAPAPQKQPATPNVIPQDAEPAAAKPDASTDRLAKVEKIEIPVAPAAPATVDTSIKKDAPAAPAQTAAARMEPLLETPAAPQSGSNHDITVRIPDAADRAVDVRFVDRAGEIHVSVRSADADTAQALRGGLNDFVSKMDHAGIRAEVWRPGADASSAQNNSQNQSFSDPRDQRGSGRNSSGSQAREDGDPQRSNKPKWVEALEKAGTHAA